jgi:hypothetical protein
MKRSRLKRVGRAARRDATAARRWREAVLAKNRGKCWRCRMPATDAHHMIGRLRCTKEQKRDPALGLPLCRSCHDWVTNNPKLAKAAGFLR